MSYAWLLGIIVGVLVGLVTLIVRSKVGQPESDERTTFLRTQAAASGFYLSWGLVFIAFVADNVQAYIRGAEPRLGSPWSAMLVAMLAIYLGSMLYRKWQSADWTDLDPTEKRRLRIRAAALLGSAVPLGMSARSAFEHGQGAVGWVLLALLCAEEVAGLFLWMRAIKRSTRGVKE